MKQIKFAIVGTNFISGHIMDAGAYDPRFRAYAVYSRRQQTGEEFANKYGIAQVFTNYDQMLACKEIDAVYIASPNSLHAEQTIAALKAGKHVLTEKAFASNTSEVRLMIEAARESGTLLMEAIKPTVTPNFKAVRDNLHLIGTPRRYFSSYCQYSSRYDRFKAGEHVNTFDPTLSNGALMDIGVYTLYPMILLFGKPLSISVQAYKLSSGVDGQGVVVFNYGEMDGIIIYSKIAAGNLPSEIQGENGTITIDRINVIDRVTFTDRNNQTTDLTQPHIGNDYYYEVAEFIDLIERGETSSSINSLEVSLAVMETMDEIRRQCGVQYPADL